MHEKRLMAMALILKAFDEGEASGLSPGVMASAALYAALSDLVTLHGQDRVGQVVANVAENIRKGAFSGVEQQPQPHLPPH